MKSLLLQSLVVMFVFLSACGGNTASQEATNEETSNQEEPASETTTDDNTTEVVEPTYTTVKDGIPSPRIELKGQVSGVDVSVVYGSPSVKEREIWGSLVPYGKVWRTGANEATTIELGKDVMVAGQALAAGKYGLFTLNEEDKTTVIFNKVHEQWGAYDYAEDQDALRVEVAPVNLEEAVEKMDFVIKGDQLILRWANRSIPIKITAS